MSLCADFENVASEGQIDAGVYTYPIVSANAHDPSTGLKLQEIFKRRRQVLLSCPSSSELRNLPGEEDVLWILAESGELDGAFTKFRLLWKRVWHAVARIERNLGIRNPKLRGCILMLGLVAIAASGAQCKKFSVDIQLEDIHFIPESIPQNRPC